MFRHHTIVTQTIVYSHCGNEILIRGYSESNESSFTINLEWPSQLRAFEFAFSKTKPGPVIVGVPVFWLVYLVLKGALAVSCSQSTQYNPLAREPTETSRIGPYPYYQSYMGNLKHHLGTAVSSHIVLVRGREQQLGAFGSGVPIVIESECKLDASLNKIIKCLQPDIHLSATPSSANNCILCTLKSLKGMSVTPGGGFGKGGNVMNGNSWIAVVSDAEGSAILEGK
ncbi:uncharacterized protein EDB93DRAFT_1101880 [Suillus bovinus]|uniref:uncharacterized protein n=1 Tax=Suillus bovinus TaxID=48563 RepID=UPI001B86925B|nr:uncharacterized protein EDB93DRAFT_1101880 [Suillus bovinus]KAG2155316.1 hypothetical protein EDB93DRAFT_1101880 [Suillus bovinus]